MNEEKTLFKGSPSQVVNLGVYLLCGVLVLADVAGALYGTPWLLLLLLAPLGFAG